MDKIYNDNKVADLIIRGQLQRQNYIVGRINDSDIKMLDIKKCDIKK